jgi:hypothetical protein
VGSALIPPQGWYTINNAGEYLHQRSGEYISFLLNPIMESAATWIDEPVGRLALVKFSTLCKNGVYPPDWERETYDSYSKLEYGE